MNRQYSNPDLQHAYLSVVTRSPEDRLQRAIEGLEAILAEARRQDSPITDRLLYIEARAGIVLQLIDPRRQQQGRAKR